MMDILGVLAVMAVVFGLSNSSKKRKPQLVAKQGNRELLRTNIGNIDRKTLKVRLASGYTAEIEVADGRARIKRMPAHICPRHICSDMGWIEPGEDKQIICMPNKLTIYFV